MSSCEAERSFSALRRIKSYFQSTMSSERFAGLALMHLHSDVDIEVCEAFNQQTQQNNVSILYFVPINDFVVIV